MKKIEVSRKVAMTVLLVWVAVSGLTAQNVKATISGMTATMSNDIISLTINSKGQVNSLTYKGVDVLNANSGGRIYYSRNDPDYAELAPTAVRIQKQTDDYVELVYSNTTASVIVEQAYILRTGVSGLYSYITHKGTSTTGGLREMRLVYRVDPNLFTYGYVDDSMQGEMPTVAEMKAANDNPIMDATYQLADGVYTKYDWANYLQRDSLHGIMSSSLGVWAIPVSHEYANGGPMKQELTVHATNKTPLVLQMLQGEHFGAKMQTFTEGEEKIYGPFFIYVNSGSSHEAMIADAKKQASIQEAQWPYSWLEHRLYPLDRSLVKGKIELWGGLSPNALQVVLAEPGMDLYDQGKKYIFWTRTDSLGNFQIKQVRKGSYTMYVYATEGEITETLSMNDITVSDSITDLGNIAWHPTKYEHLLWRLGDNDRMSDGFRYSDTIRSYGLYNLPPTNLTYTMGTSLPEKDWYYAQTKAGTWTIVFNCDEKYSGIAWLTVSIAGATNSPKLAVAVNGSQKASWSFSNDASIYRSGVLGGRHSLKTVSFSSSYLNKGSNKIAFTISDPGSGGGIMYDCIKLEVGNLITGMGDDLVTLNPMSVQVYPNPFDVEATIDVFLPENDDLNINVYDINGRWIKTLCRERLSAGNYSFTWQAEGQPAGIYYYKVCTSKNVISGKIIKSR